MLDYTKPIVRRKPDISVIHTETNDLTNRVNTMKEVRQFVKCVKELDKEEEVKIGFSSVINRSDRNLEKEIVDFNLKLKRYCEGNQFLFIDNDNIDKSCLHNSKLHLNQKGTNILCQNIKKSLYDYRSSLTHSQKIDIARPSLSKDLDQILFDFRCKNPSKLNFAYLNISSVRNKF